MPQTFSHHNIQMWWCTHDIQCCF